MIALIAALSKNRVIGSENRLPWHLPQDLKNFRAVTLGKPVVMGRKTYESIGRLLPGRENRIITRNPDFKVEGARLFSSLTEAIQDFVEAPEGAREANPLPRKELMVIGGGQIYEQAMPFADRLYLTEIDAEIEGDAYFPQVDLVQFEQISSQEFEGDPAVTEVPGLKRYWIRVYEKKTGAPK